MRLWEPELLRGGARPSDTAPGCGVAVGDAAYQVPGRRLITYIEQPDVSITTRSGSLAAGYPQRGSAFSVF